LGHSVESIAIELRDADRVSLHPTDPTEVTLTGSDLRNDAGESASIWTSFAATVETLDTDSKDKNRVRVRITPTERTTGLVAIRAFTVSGISQPLLFTIESRTIGVLPPAPDTVLRSPAVLEGRAVGLGEHRLAIECEKGKQVVAEVLGARVGSDIDGVLILLNKDGRELSFSDDHPSTGSDPLLVFTPEYDGVHYLLVRDVEFRGGMRLQVRITDEPAVAICYPGAIRCGETRQVKYRRVGSNDSKSVIALATDASGISFVGEPGEFARILQTDLPIHYIPGRDVSPSDVSPSDVGPSAPLAIPVMVCGHLPTDGAVEEISFVARKGDRLTIETASFGPHIGHIRLFKDSSQVGEHHWGRDPNGLLSVLAAEAGVYRIEIRDALGPNRLGPGIADISYCVSIRNDLAPAKLKVAVSPERKIDPKNAPHRFAVRAGERFSIAVRVERRGYDGPISLHAEMGGQPCHVTGNLPEKKNDAEITVTAPNFTDKPTIQQLHLYGTCQVSGRTLRVPLDLREHFRSDLPAMTQIPACVAAGMAVSISKSDEPAEISAAAKEKK
jgi:hypothetical protein